MARPIEFTDDVVRKLEDAFAFDATVEEACLYADISRSTYYDNIKLRPELVDRFEELRERPVLLARQTVVNSLKDPANAFKYLEKKRKKEFGAAIDLTSGGDKIGEGANPEAIKAFNEYRQQQKRLGEVGEK